MKMMFTRGVLGPLLLVGLLAPVPAMGSSTTIELVQHGDGLISLYLNEAPAVDAARLLAAVLDADFAFLGDTDQRLTLSLERVSYRAALERVLLSSKMNWAIQGQLGRARSKIVVSTPQPGPALNRQPPTPVASAEDDSYYDDYDEEEDSGTGDAGGGQTFREALAGRSASAGQSSGGGTGFSSQGRGGGTGFSTAPTNAFAAALQRARDDAGPSSSSGTPGQRQNPPTNPFGVSGPGTGNRTAFRTRTGFGQSSTNSASPANIFANPGGFSAATPSPFTNPFGSTPATPGAVNPFANPFARTGTSNTPPTNPFVQAGSPPQQQQQQQQQQQTENESN